MISEYSEPGPEEGGEDIFGLPSKCTCCGCEEFTVTCLHCKTSYGPPEQQAELDAANRAYRKARLERILELLNEGHIHMAAAKILADIGALTDLEGETHD